MNYDLARGIQQILSSRIDPTPTFFLKKQLVEKAYDIEDFSDTLYGLLSDGKIRYTSTGLEYIGLDLNTSIESSDDVVRGYLEGQKVVGSSEQTEIFCNPVKSHILEFLSDDLNSIMIRDYQKYKMTQNQFISLYDSDKETYHYLQHRFIPGTGNLMDIKNNPDKTDSFLEKLNSLICKSVESNGEIVELSPVSIIMHVLEQNGAPMEDKELLSEYDLFLESNNLGEYTDLVIQKKNLRGIAEKENGIVYVATNTFAAFQFSKKELLDLFDMLNLSRYANLYVTSGLIYRHNLNHMKDFSISNDYELYYLMYKYKAYLKRYNITFVRVPSISFGELDIFKQIEDLLRECGRISMDDFYNLFEERYGMAKDSLRSSYMRHYRNYVVDGSYYDFNVLRLSPSQLDLLEPLFTRSWYPNVDAKSIFKDNLGAGAQNYFNAYNLNELGYSCTKDVVYSNRYVSLKECIENALKGVDFFKIDPVLQDIKSIQPILKSCKRNLDVIPISSEEYITLRKLNEVGITKDLMRSYSDNFIENLEKGKCFTLQYMRYVGYEHELEDYGFEDVFYRTLIEANPYIRGSTIKKAHVYMYGDYYEKDSALMSIVDYALGGDNSMDEYDLSQRIYEIFGVDMEGELKLTDRSSDMFYYNPKTLKVYRDKDCFYEELIKHE